MVKKIIIFFLFYISINLYGRDITIFFLKDGSILQGKIVNENQYRIFLKTDQGTIKIIPSDVLGREDAANKGDLTFFAERLEQLQQNVRYLAGKVNHMKDSLSISLEGVNDLYFMILGNYLLNFVSFDHANEAITYLKKSISLNQKNAYAWYLLSRAYGQIGLIPLANYATAERYFLTNEFDNLISCLT